MQKVFHILLFIITVGESLFAFSNVAPRGLSTGGSVVPNDKDYYKYNDIKNDVQIIYTKDNIPFAKQTLAIESPLNKDYRDFFDWKLDETLYVGLISDYNQIPNAFSTQLPNNRQINYVGGSSKVDYFSSRSWLNTLLYHETAHNYQVNVKGSVVSQSLHSVIGNGTFFIPLLPIALPNVVENFFMLEGNAVFNESWHGNGGRLYSGRLKAETILQAKAGNIKAGEVYNSKLAFPYGEIVYIQGGFYNLYIAQTYGIKALNSYFKYKSEDWWWPFRTNWSMQDAIGVNFVKSLAAFEQEYKDIGKDFISQEGEWLTSSQFFYSLGNSHDEIFFITNESGVRTPELVVFNKQMQELTKKRESYVGGKVIKKDGIYYTQGGRYTSPTRIYQGLFDKDAFIKEGSASKMVQAYLSDNRAVYFDVHSSFSEPQLYVGKEFFSRVNSSVIVDRYDNLYYFKQDGKTRTLYKNKTPLYALEGFYSFVCDVDSRGAIYFVANSDLGASLYVLKDSQVKRVSSADNIVEARLINDDTLLIAAISDKDYYYVKSGIESIDEEPYATRLFFEDKPYYGEYTTVDESANLNATEDKRYHAMFDMDYSGADVFFGVTAGGLVGTLNVNYGDPLTQNALNLFISRDESNVTIAGVGYSNSEYLLEYSLQVYGVLDKWGRDDVRDAGVILSAELPFLQTGYYYGALGIDYFQDYDTEKREPLSATVTLADAERFGVSMYSNYLNMLTLYGVKEREDAIFGGSYSFAHELPYEFYFGFAAKYSSSDAQTYTDARGVKLSQSQFSLDADPSTIDMPNISSSLYVQKAAFGELNLYKVFNLSAYYFTFPLSLRRESIYAKYRHYNLESFSQNVLGVNETRLGVTLSSVILNSLVLPVSFEYLYNDASFVKNNHYFRILIGSSF